jgi:hypothetical protein
MSDDIRFIDDVIRLIRESCAEQLEAARIERETVGHDWRALQTNVSPAAKYCARCKINLNGVIFWPGKPRRRSTQGQARPTDSVGFSAVVRFRLEAVPPRVYW